MEREVSLPLALRGKREERHTILSLHAEIGGFEGGYSAHLSLHYYVGPHTWHAYERAR